MDSSILRALPLAALLLGTELPSTAASSPAQLTATQPDNVTRTKIKIAVNNFAADYGYTSITLIYDSATDFRVFNAGALVGYGYYDTDGVDEWVYINDENYLP